VHGVSGSSKLGGNPPLGTDRPAWLPGAVEAYPAALVVQVAEAAGDSGGVFDHPVHACLERIAWLAV